MSAVLPDSIDAWRAVGARRVYSGSIALSRFVRLRDSLVDADGECRFRMEFGRDEFGGARVRLDAEAELPLECQRSLERFLFPVRIAQQLGLLHSESEESGLGVDVEPVLVPGDGNLNPLDLIEDELILALPVVALREGENTATAAIAEPQDDEPRASPFAALAALKHKI